MTFTDILIILGIVHLVGWGYIALVALTYYTLFRRAINGDRFVFSVIWPISVPLWLYHAVLPKLARRARRGMLARMRVRR